MNQQSDGMRQLAWILTEGFQQQPEKIVGIALTNEAARAWVRANDEYGYSRTSMPYPVIEPTPEVTP